MVIVRDTHTLYITHNWYGLRVGRLEDKWRTRKVELGGERGCGERGDSWPIGSFSDYPSNLLEWDFTHRIP